jgi:hypothetical protein
VVVLFCRVDRKKIEGRCGSIILSRRQKKNGGGVQKKKFKEKERPIFLGRGRHFLGKKERRVSTFLLCQYKININLRNSKAFISLRVARFLSL